MPSGRSGFADIPLQIFAPSRQLISLAAGPIGRTRRARIAHPAGGIVDGYPGERNPMKSWYLGIAVAVVMTLLALLHGA